MIELLSTSVAKHQYISWTELHFYGDFDNFKSFFQIVAQLHSDQVLKFQHVSALCLEEPLRRDKKFQILFTKQNLPSTSQRLQMLPGVSLSLQVTMILRFSI